MDLHAHENDHKIKSHITLSMLVMANAQKGGERPIQLWLYGLSNECMYMIQYNLK